MTWSELVAKASRETGIPAPVVRVLMSAYWKGLRSELLRTSSVPVSGWGSFRRVERKPRIAHPVKGKEKELFIPSTLSVRFRLAPKMKQFLNKKKKVRR